MEKNKPIHKEHSVTIKDRAEMTLSGVSEVVSFSDTAVILRTCQGDLTIRGDKLNIGRLNTDTGELFICGRVSLLKYSKARKQGSVLEGLFK